MSQKLGGQKLDTQRLSVNINAETAGALNELANRQGVTVTEIVRRAISVYKYIEDQRADGKKVQLVDAQTQEVITLEFV